MSQLECVDICYRYESMTEGGTFDQMLSKAGEAVGSVIAAAISSRFGASPASAAAATVPAQSIGHDIGSSVGQVIDNLGTIERNLGTLMTEINDYRTWTKAYPESDMSSFFER